MLHSARCDHIAWFGARDVPSEEWVYTTGRGKWCGADLRELEAFVGGAGRAVTRCSTCGPVAPPRPAPPAAEPAVDGARVGSAVTIVDDGGVEEPSR